MMERKRRRERGAREENEGIQRKERAKVKKQEEKNQEKIRELQ